MKRLIFIAGSCGLLLVGGSVCYVYLDRFDSPDCAKPPPVIAAAQSAMSRSTETASLVTNQAEEVPLNAALTGKVKNAEAGAEAGTESILSLGVEGQTALGPGSRGAVRRLMNTALPIKDRLAEIKAISALDNAVSAQTLMALGDEETYLNYAAVEALGHMTQPGIAQYLEDKLEHADPKVLCAAIHSLSLIAGEAAVSHIIETLHSNTVRPDGYQKLVCSACVKALGRIRTASAVPVLKQELTQTVGRYMQYDYGSTVVDALMEIGDPAGHPVLLAYANRLKHLQQGMTDNPMGQYYLDRKIEETLAAADQLDSTGGPK